MKELRFRVYHKEMGKMIEFGLWDLELGFADDYYVQDKKVMRSTGIRAKGGKMIFEGDIIQQTKRDWGSKKVKNGYGRRVEVKWKNGAFNIRKGDNYEIIGNTYTL